MIFRFGLELSGEVVDLLKRDETRRYSASALAGPPPFPFSDLFFSQLQQLFLCLLHLAGGPSDGNPVRAGTLGGEVNVNAAAVVHDGAHQAALGADQRVVQPGWNDDLRLLNVSLRGGGGGV